MKERCPVCGEMFSVSDDLQKGELIYCSECYADLKVVDTRPLRFKEVEDVDEDYYEYDD